MVPFHLSLSIKGLRRAGTSRTWHRTKPKCPWRWWSSHEASVAERPTHSLVPGLQGMLGSVEVSGLVGKKMSQRSSMSVSSFMKRVSGSCVAEWWGVGRCVLTAHPQGWVGFAAVG